MDEGKNFKGEKWTVLIYAAANNDLESHIYQQYLMIKNTSDLENTDVLFQISKPSKGACQNTHGNNINEEWCGTRRYVINKDRTLLAANLGTLNMSEPSALYEFLVWGGNNFPSDHIMLIISGHSAGFVGMLRDYASDHYTFMGVQGFAHALSLFKKRTGKSIDFLVMDTCFMDLVEIWFEISLRAEGAIKYGILPQENSPLQGLPCHFIISMLKKNNLTHLGLSEVLTHMIASVNSNYNIEHHLFAISADEEFFLSLKLLITILSETVVKEDMFLTSLTTYSEAMGLNNDFISLPSLLRFFEDNFPATNSCCRQINELLDKIIVHGSLNEKQQSFPRIYLPHNFRIYLKYKDTYNKMLFCINNQWTLCHETIFK